MTYEQISALLDKYWDGETSLEEERALKAYFAAWHVDERLRNVAPLFTALRQEQTVEWQRNKEVKLNAGPSVSWRRLTAVAAAVLVLLFAGWWWLNRPVQTTEPMPLAGHTPVQPSTAQPDGNATDVPAAKTNLPASSPKTPVKPGAHPHRRKTEVALAKVDPEAEKAMEEIKAALALLSSKLNKGKQEATKNLHEIETLDKVIRKPTEG